MEHPENHYYKLNRFFLLAAGLWPYQNVWRARLIRGIFTVLYLLCIIVELVNIFTSEITTEFMILAVQIFGFIIGFLCHMYVHVGHLDKFKELFERMWQDWALQKTDHETRIMHQQAEITKLVTYCCAFLTYGIQFMYFVWVFIPEILDVLSPMNESRPQRQPLGFNFDNISIEKYFYLIRYYLFGIIIYSPLCLLATSTLYLVLTQHVCAMYKLLGHRAELLFYVAAENDLNHETRIRCNMENFVRLHYSIIEFIGIIKSCYTVQLLLDLLGCLGLLSITLIELISIANIEIAIRSIGLSTLGLIYLFLYNYMGQRITDLGLDICKKLYNSTWYNAIIFEKNSILLIMRQCLHPLVVTACNFYVLSLQNFVKVLQLVISYSMFINYFQKTYLFS